MLIKSFRLTNYSSFQDTLPIEFESGINLVVGQNNVGKSSLLKALAGHLTDLRHRNQDMFNHKQVPAPKAHAVLEASGFEIIPSIYEYQSFSLPAPEGTAEASFEFYNSDDERLYPVVVSHRGDWEHDINSEHSIRRFGGNVLSIENRDGNLLLKGLVNSDNDMLGYVLKDAWGYHSYYFSAQRLVSGRDKAQRVPRLAADASDLPSFLATMQSEQGSLFEKLKANMRLIFPTVGNISVGFVEDSDPLECEVRIWPTEEMLNRALSFPLDDSGTGVGQALAILAAIMSTEYSCIIIDEINSFLHPAAAKTLVDIIRRDHSEHQYIISTHSTDIMSVSEPSSIHLVTRHGYISEIQRVDTQSAQTFRLLSAHLGVSMSDVFAADHVLWVEGETEATCFPELLKLSGYNIPQGLLIRPVSKTGDFLAKRGREVVYSVYNQLSSSAANLPVTIAFSFDRDLLSEADMQKQIHESDGLIHFLPRRNFECFVIHPPVLTDLINQHLTEDLVSVSEVQSATVRLAGDQELRCSPVFNGDLSDPTWLTAVDGAKLLTRLFTEVTGARLEYDKVRHSAQAMTMIYQRDPAPLGDLVAFVQGLVSTLKDGQVHRPS